jgi:hypothetical protein
MGPDHYRSRAARKGNFLSYCRLARPGSLAGYASRPPVPLGQALLPAAPGRIWLCAVLLGLLVASQMGCTGVNRNKEKLDPELARALLCQDAASILVLAEGRTARIDLVVIKSEWPELESFYSALMQEGVLRRGEDTTKFVEHFGSLPALSFSLPKGKDVRDATPLQATLVLIRPAFGKVISLDQHGRLARVEVEVITTPTRTLEYLTTAAKEMQKPAHVWGRWWEHLPPAEAKTQLRTYILVNDQRRDAVKKGWGMFAASGPIEDLFSSNGMNREGGANALGELGEVGAPGAPFLTERLADREASGRLNGAMADGSALYSDVRTVQGCAAEALRKIGAPAVEPLLEAISTHSKLACGPLLAGEGYEHSDIIERAIKLLGEIGDRRAIEPLTILGRTCVRWSQQTGEALLKLQGRRPGELM